MFKREVEGDSKQNEIYNIDDIDSDTNEKNSQMENQRNSTTEELKHATDNSRVDGNDELINEMKKKIERLEKEKNLQMATRNIGDQVRIRILYNINIQYQVES